MELAIFSLSVSQVGSLFIRRNKKICYLASSKSCGIKGLKTFYIGRKLVFLLSKLPPVTIFLRTRISF